MRDPAAAATSDRHAISGHRFTGQANSATPRRAAPNFRDQESDHPRALGHGPAPSERTCRQATGSVTDDVNTARTAWSVVHGRPGGDVAVPPTRAAPVVQ